MKYLLLPCFLLVTATLHAQFLFNGTNVNCSPTISGQPASITRLTNTSAPFSVTAAGPFLTYRWRTNGVTVGNGIDASGATTASLILSNTPFAMSGLTADCVVSNVCGSLTSSVATLTVTNGTGGGGSSTEYYTYTSGPISGTLGVYTLGMKITVGGANIVVTHVGRWVFSGNSDSHKITIYDSSCAVVASATLNTSGLSPGFNYVACPATLLAGQDYYIGSLEQGVDSSADHGSATASYTGVATYDTDTYSSGDACNNTAGGGGTPYAGVNFKYSSP